jgi:hypothetical protein
LSKASWALAVLAFVVAAACSQTEDGPLPLPTSAFPSSSGATGGPGATGSTASGPSGIGLPTTSPGAGTGNLTGGSVEIRTSGALEVVRTLPTLVSAVYAAPPGGFALVWTAGGTDATILGMGGASFVGTRPTSPELTLTLTVQTADGIASFLSMNGECDVTIDEALEREIVGSFRCDDLPSDDGDVVSVAATFEAEG